MVLRHPLRRKMMGHFHGKIRPFSLLKQANMSHTFRRLRADFATKNKAKTGEWIVTVLQTPTY